MSETYQPGSTLRFRGRTYLLFKRGEGTSYSLRIQHQGKRRILATGHADLTLAKAKAKELLGEILEGKPVERVPRGRSAPTIGKVLDAFKEGDRHVRSRTGRHYELSLLRMIKDVLGLDTEAARKETLGILTEDFVRRYQALKQKTGGGVDYVTPMTINTGINSVVRQARGVFSRTALKIYERAGLSMPPTLDGFLKAQFLKEVSHRYSDNPIPKEQIVKLNKDLPKLKKQDERLWAVHLMIRLMGLRDSEIERARRHWLVKRGDTTYLVINRREGEAAPKRSDGEVPVPQVLLDYFKSHSDDHLIPAKHPTERHDLICKIHSKWVRARVPGRTKTNHELRKWAGSMVATKTNSWERAAEFLRIDIETAKLHYLSFVTQSKPLSLKDLGL
jgi:hypothetical protein